MLLSSLADYYAGIPAAILGGGPSLPDDLAAIASSNLLLIAVNYHAHEIGLQPHFVVYLDDPRDRGQMLKILEQEDVVKVSPDYGSDIEMDVKYWRGRNSATTAAWLGLYMGCNPVYLCGMDMYRGARKYCHDNYEPKQVPRLDLSEMMRPWIEECRASVPHPERLVAVSGPLRSLFPLQKGP
jgi:hypothetical protein